MKASIRTFEDSEPNFGPKKRGKTARISRGSFTVEAVRRGKKKETVLLEITATRSRNPGTGDRGGPFKAYTDTLKLELEPEDLKKIMTAALENGLISVSFKAKKSL